MRSTVSEVRDELRDIVATLDPEVLPAAAAQRLVSLFADIEKLAAAGMALVARRVEEAGVWRQGADRSAADWLARTTGTTTGAARATLETGRAVADQPQVDAALRAGDLSPAQAVEVSAAVALDPTAAEELLSAARSETVKELKERCTRVRAAAAGSEERHAELHRSRHLRTWTTSDGAAHLHVKTTPDRVARLHAMLVPHLKEAFDIALKAGVRESHEACAHDALFHLLQASGVESIGPGRGSHVKTVIRIDHTAFTRGQVEPGETCEIVGVGPIPVSVAKALSVDAFYAAVITRGVDIVNVAHLGRAVTAEQRTALQLRDPTCAVPGCTTSAGLEIDHTTSATGWADTRRTTLDELARLCHHHHQQKTHHGYTLIGVPGQWQWRPPTREEREHGDAA